MWMWEEEEAANDDEEELAEEEAHKEVDATSDSEEQVVVGEAAPASPGNGNVCGCTAGEAGDGEIPAVEMELLQEIG